MSAERDKSILIGGGLFIAGFVSGVAAIIWILNRDVPERDEKVDDSTKETPTGNVRLFKKKTGS